MPTDDTKATGQRQIPKLPIHVGATWPKDFTAIYDANCICVAVAHIGHQETGPCIPNESEARAFAAAIVAAVNGYGRMREALGAAAKVLRKCSGGSSIRPTEEEITNCRAAIADALAQAGGGEGGR